MAGVDRLVRFLAHALSYYTTHPKFAGFPKEMTVVAYWSEHPCDGDMWLSNVGFESEVF